MYFWFSINSGSPGIAIVIAGLDMVLLSGLPKTSFCTRGCAGGDGLVHLNLESQEANLRQAGAPEDCSSYKQIWGRHEGPDHLGLNAKTKNP